jgi:hypothetical protein
VMGPAQSAILPWPWGAPGSGIGLRVLPRRAWKEHPYQHRCRFAAACCEVGWDIVNENHGLFLSWTLRGLGIRGGQTRSGALCARVSTVRLRRLSVGLAFPGMTAIKKTAVTLYSS